MPRSWTCHSPSYRSHLAIGCLIVCIIFATPELSAQTASTGAKPLPPESVLPGQDIFPGQNQTARRINPIVIGATGQPRHDLPDEATLPTMQQQAATVNDVDEAKERLLRLNASADNRPWLRLEQKGHIDRVRTLAFSHDSRRIYAAGDDKHVIVYQQADNGTWNYDRTIRWQIQRGNSGRVYSVAAAPGLLALAGRSATGGVGEILLTNPITGQLVQMLVGNPHPHQDRITSLAFSQTGKQTALASMDHRGTLLHWTLDAETGIWSAKRLADDPEFERRLEARLMHPIAAVSPQRVAAAVPVAEAADGAPLWNLRLYDTGDARRNQLLLSSEQRLKGLVTAMAASVTGGRLAAADESGQLFLWNLTQSGSAARYQLSAPALALSFNNDGTQLAIGTVGPKRSLTLWDVRDVRHGASDRNDPVAADILACCISPDGKSLAYTQGSEVVIRSHGDHVEQNAVVRSTILGPTRVAFSRKPPYRIGISTREGSNPSIETAFAPLVGQLETDAMQQDDWHSVDENNFGWTVETDGSETWLVENGQRRGSLPLKVHLHGAYRTACWIAKDRRPFAVAIGTSATEIYVFRLVNQGACPLVRKFRGHTGSVTSLGVSHDGRYLVSSASDRTVQIWNLSDLGSADSMIDRWGATFELQDGNVTVASIRPDGPLYFRGVRQGDEVRSLIWQASQPRTVSDRELIMDRLRNGSPDQLTAFEYRRGRAPMATFQSYPAWQPLATLVVDDHREWAFWTPAGFYDASFEGHKLFGWQVNRGPNVLPDYFQAAQVRGFLERPAIMARLLEAGSLDAAFNQQAAMAPANWSSVLAQQQQLRPQVVILQPTPDQEVAEASISVVAEIAVNKGQMLVPPKAFANGVVGTHRELRSKRDEGELIVYQYAWLMALPADKKLLLQVAAATEDETADIASVRVRRTSTLPKKRARMFVVAAGINDYRDSRIPKLEFALGNAIGLASVLDSQSEPLYDCEALTLLGDRVTLQSWGVTMEEYAASIRDEALPDDLLVIFLSGHGVRDEQTDQYYFVSANASWADVQAGKFGDCMSFKDLALFAEVPCRKLVILDTCHSGAIQPLRQRELKSALRALQDDVFLTLTASEGGQEAVEDAEKRFGRFTFRLIEALAGKADVDDGDKNGIVSLAETVRYVQRTVYNDSQRSTTLQYPMAGPAELIDIAEIPITSTRD